MQIIAIYHSKGGVGKTTTSVNLAYQAAQSGQRTLICDLDPQAASTFYFRVKPKIKSGVKGFVKGGKQLAQNIKATDFENLDLLPADFRFRSMDLELAETKKSKKRLHKILADVAEDYDLIILDCPPNLSNVSENIFNAADKIVVPLIPTTLSVRSFEQILRFFEKKGYKTRKIIAFFSMVEKRKLLHREVMAEMISGYDNILPVAIPFRSDVEKMGIYRTPVQLLAPRSPVVKAYRELWKALQTPAK